MFLFQNSKGFIVDLLEFLTNQYESLQSLANIAYSVTIEDRLKHSYMALEALFNVIKNTAGVEIQCIGHFRLLFGLLSVSCQKIQKGALNVLSTVTRNQECVNDIASCEILGYLLLALYTLTENQMQILETLYALMSTTKIVKEALNKGTN